jgi:hypothetical protein
MKKFRILFLLIPILLTGEPTIINKTLIQPPSPVELYNRQLDKLGELIAGLEGKIRGRQPVDKDLIEIAGCGELLDKLAEKIEKEINNTKKSDVRIFNAAQAFRDNHNQLKTILTGIHNNKYDNITNLKELLKTPGSFTEKQEDLEINVLPIKRNPKIIPEPEKGGKFRGDSNPAPEDTMETMEIQFTPKIKALACSLEYDPRRIFEYVRNQIHYQPYFGSSKQAQSVLLEKMGNDFDQSTLLIALLRVSKIPARYGYGIIDLPVPDLLNLLRVDSLSAAISSFAGRETNDPCPAE